MYEDPRAREGAPHQDSLLKVSGSYRLRHAVGVGWHIRFYNRVLVNVPHLPESSLPLQLVRDSEHIMEMRLGNSGLKVSRIILGCMSYGSSERMPWVLGEEEGIRHVKAAYDIGTRRSILQITVTEKHVGQNPEDFGYVNQEGLSRKHIFDSVKHSLRRLQLDYIDVLQFHAMQNYAIAHGLTPSISMQNHYNMIYREEEQEMMPVLKSPPGRGLLARPARAERTTRGSFDRWHAMYLDDSGAAQVIDRVEKLSKNKGVSTAQISMAWILSKDGRSAFAPIQQLSGLKSLCILGVTSVVAAPVIGTTPLDNLYDIVGGSDVSLTGDEVKYLEEAYRPMPILGHS
ncbi:Aldo-keto reductase 1 [Heterobasidion irregulare TC 32-1]|uniref:Aldo-keto reductase 1 n=1 Tax=Heterobasidion irregulare (strain TC 32-1) TaxID=747525 RepID=W4KCZ9_HETIT|nr:Aldo-keto reductase 1 [Heterobasidion irregulare TC 32-1]ETW83663.1 Aldo-keto reductase 1 [Heterobasidion irregulare TC 32-1]